MKNLIRFLFVSLALGTSVMFAEVTPAATPNATATQHHAKSGKSAKKAKHAKKHAKTKKPGKKHAK
jgi:hypothetical protein